MENAVFRRHLLLAYHYSGNGNDRVCTALDLGYSDKKETVLFSIYLSLAGYAFYGIAVAFGLRCVIRIYV